MAPVPSCKPCVPRSGEGQENAPSASFGGGRGTRFCPPLGGASRAFGLPQAAAKRILRAEARTHLHGPLGRMTDAKP